MSATWTLFERWKARMGYESNNAAASELGTARQTVQNWKDGRNGDAHFIERMANDLGEDPVPVILEAFAEAARDAQARRSLQRLAKRFRGAGIALALGALPLMAPSVLEARSMAPKSIHYANAASRRDRRSGFGQGRRPSKRSYTTWKKCLPALRWSA